MRRLILISVIALLGSCATLPTATTSTGFDAGNLVSTRDYLTVDQPLKAIFQTGKPRAFVLLDDNDPGRNEKIRKAFEGLPTADMVEDVNPFANIVPTYWMLKTPSVPGEDDLDARCSELIADFDFQRAKQLAGAFGLPRSSTAYLMAVDGAGKLFYIDIDHGSQKQLDGLMRAWFVTATAEQDKTGIDLEEWWRKTGKKLCGADFVQSALTALVPGWAGRIVGIAFKAGGCEVEAPPVTPPLPATIDI